MVTSTHSDALGAVPDDRVDRRVIEGALRCIARWGVAKTTLDDVAREAGCSRATIYRTFEGGKDGVLAATVDHEVSRLLDQLGAAAASADTLEDVLVVALSTASRFLADNGALRYLVEHELEIVLPQIAFDRIDHMLERIGTAALPWLTPYLSTSDARATAEWGVRLVLSYAALPSATVDLTNDASARRLVRRYVLPGLTAGSIDRPATT